MHSRPRSSTGQSEGLLIPRLWVRVPPRSLAGRPWRGVLLFSCIQDYDASLPSRPSRGRSSMVRAPAFQAGDAGSSPVDRSRSSRPWIGVLLRISLVRKTQPVRYPPRPMDPSYSAIPLRGVVLGDTMVRIHPGPRRGYSEEFFYTATLHQVMRVRVPHGRHAVASSTVEHLT